MSNVIYTCAQSTEILGGLGDDFSKQAEDNATNRFAPDIDIEEALGGHFGLELLYAILQIYYKMKRKTAALA